jgi:hypothetical protein
MGAEMLSTLERLGLPALEEGAMVMMAASPFAYGLAAVWLYSAIRPRYGAGPATALRAGFAVWAVGCLLPQASLLVLGVLEPRLFTMSVTADLVMVPAATALGARLYRENGEVAVSGAARSAPAHA